jgi:crotonobetainyl-CoA:carnitine CoA-transferase CaiB-like acyl-CoA transferase
MRPLDGVKILDFSHMLSGPTCTAMLGLLGAEVVKIERPKTGDGFRHYTEHAGPAGMSIPFAAANTGKKSITLNLAEPQAMEVVHRLTEWADVVVENFRPGVPAKRGIDWDSLKRINPRLVYCSITGFGGSGPMRDWGALDQIVQAMSGLMWMSGEPDSDPIKIGFPVLDTFTGYMSVIAILAALRRRDVTGEGEFIDVSMLDCSLKMMGGTVAGYLYSGQLPPRTGNRGYRMVATADVYKTADGYICLGANEQGQYESFCRVLGHPEWIDDPRFVDHTQRVVHNEALRAAFTEALQDRSGAELEAVLSKMQIPVSMVRDLSQITSHPQIAEGGLLVDAAMPAHDQPIKVIGPGFRLQGEALEPGAVPSLGEHTDDVLALLGYDGAAIAGMRADGVLG